MNRNLPRGNDEMFKINLFHLGIHCHELSILGNHDTFGYFTIH